MQRRNNYNPKRRLRTMAWNGAHGVRLAELAAQVCYGGNPEHKRSPGDFGLTPPALPRRGKTLCDDVNIFRRTEALSLLRDGLRCGLVDARWDGSGWPQLVWAVTADGQPLEAQREADGRYHGYPMPEADPLRTAVVEYWKTRCLTG